VLINRPLPGLPITREEVPPHTGLHPRRGRAAPIAPAVHPVHRAATVQADRAATGAVVTAAQADPAVTGAVLPAVHRVATGPPDPPRGLRAA
jgi:hypothetical protein